MLVYDKPIYVTDRGLEELEEELVYLRDVKRPELIDRMQEAKGGGDWMDQTEYMLIEEELNYNENRIKEIQYMIDQAQIIGPANQDNIVNIGETVVIEIGEGEIEKYRIVGVAEAEPAEGSISNESPLGKALLNKNVGDEIIFDAPAGKIRCRILSVN